MAHIDADRAGDDGEAEDLSGWPVVYGIRCEPAHLQLKCPEWRRINEENIVDRLWEEFRESGGAYYTPHAILRILIERGGDYEATRATMVGRIKFFDELGVRELAKSWEGKGWADLVHGDRMSTCFPLVGKLGMGKNGNGINYVNVGRMPPSGMTDIASAANWEEFKTHFIQWIIHTNLMAMAESNRVMAERKKLVGFVMILDFKDTSYWGLAKHRNGYQTILKTFLEVANEYFDPGYRFYVVNAPYLFKGMWAVFKLWLRTQTVAKYVIDTGIPAEMVEALGAENLPGSLGGTAPEPPLMEPLPRDWRGCRYYTQGASG